MKLPIDFARLRWVAWPVKHRHTCRCGRSWVHKYEGCNAHECPSCGDDQYMVTFDHLRPTTQQRRRVNLAPAAFPV